MTTQHTSFSFNGTGRAFFPIWTVHLFLTIFTLGFYYAWFKVKTQRYFWQNLNIAGSSFDYHGKPLNILIGYLAVGGITNLLHKTSILLPILSIFFFLLFALSWPVFKKMYLHSLTRNISHKNTRFDFTGKTFDAFIYFLLLPLISIVSIGLLHPLIKCVQHKYVIGHICYGQRAFKFSGKAFDFYKIFFFTLVLLGLTLFYVCMAFSLDRETLMHLAPSHTAPQSVAETVMAFDKWLVKLLTLEGLLKILGLLACFSFVGAYSTAQTKNLIWNNTTLGDTQFLCTQRTLEVFALEFVNRLLTLATLGLFIPFATIRRNLYFAEHLTISIDDALGAMDSDPNTVHSDAQMEGMGEKLGVDLGLDI